MPGSWEIKALRDNRILVAVIMPPDLAVTMDFAQNLSRIQLPPGSDYMRVVGLPWGPARNQAAKTALANGYTLAFLDADIRVPSDAYMTLFATGLPYISGLYFQRFFPHVPVTFNVGRDEQGTILKVPITGWKPGDIFPSDFVPAGLLLIRRPALEACLARWPRFFEWGVDVAPLPSEEGQVPPFSEDFTACWRAKQLGVQPYMHSGVVGLHEVRAVVGPRWVVPYPSSDPLHGVVGVL